MNQEHYSTQFVEESSSLLPASKRKKFQDVIDFELIEKCSADISTRSLLAKWWKRNKDKLTIDASCSGELLRLPNSTNPHTLIHSISKYPMVKSFLRARCDHLHCMPEGTVVLKSLSECYHILGETKNALHYINKACCMAATPAAPTTRDDTITDNDELEWTRSIIKRQWDNERLQIKLREAHLNNDKCPTKLPDPIQVEKIDYKSLSYDQFMSDYACTKTPVIITGLNLTRNKWTLDYISEVIGDKTAPLRQPVAGSVEWARLESGGECRVRDFIQNIKTQKTNNRYLFDWSLPIHCPELAQELTIPDYFAGNLLQDTPPGTLYRDSWPSLFVSPSNITSSLHIDAFGSNFWMALFEGKKRWLFFPPEDTPCLYPSYTHSLDPVFEVDLDDPSTDHHPLISLTHPRECLLEPGEVLFVPARSPHQVTSLGPSVAISANYIDRSNIATAIAELAHNSLSDPRAGVLLKILKEKEGRMLQLGN